MSGLSGVIQWGTLPVPYVAAWSSEDVAVIRRDPVIANKPAIFRAGRRGLGRPMFGKMDEARTRRVVVQRLCQVCARPFGDAGYVLDVPYGLADGAPLVHEPPSCATCFQVALRLCPGIDRLLQRPRVLVAMVSRYETMAVVVAPTDAEGHDPQLNAVLEAWKGEPVTGYVRPALTVYDVLDYAAVREIAGQRSA